MFLKNRNARRFRLMALFLVILAALMLVTTIPAFAQGVEELPDTLDEFLDVDRLPLLLGIVSSFIMTWFVRWFPGTSSNVLIALTVVAQILVALLVVLATNFLPATYIDQYGGLYAAFRAGIVALLGNQSVYFLMIRGAQNDRQGSHG